MRKRLTLGSYSRPMPMVLGGARGGGQFLMSEEQGNLAPKKQPPPQDHPRTLGIVLL